MCLFLLYCICFGNSMHFAIQFFFCFVFIQEEIKSNKKSFCCLYFLWAIKLHKGLFVSRVKNSHWLTIRKFNVDHTWFIAWWHKSRMINTKAYRQLCPFEVRGEQIFYKYAHSIKTTLRSHDNLLLSGNINKFNKLF